MSTTGPRARTRSSSAQANQSLPSPTIGQRRSRRQVSSQPEPTTGLVAAGSRAYGGQTKSQVAEKTSAREGASGFAAAFNSQRDAVSQPTLISIYCYSSQSEAGKQIWLMALGCRP